MTTKTDKIKKSNWLLAIPIYNLIIEKEIGGEIKIKNVTFVAKYKIPRIRKRLGIKESISSINKMIKSAPDIFARPLFEEANTYAFLRCGNMNEEEAKSKILLIKEVLWILASSQIMYSHRNNLIYFGLPEHATHHSKEYYLFNTKDRDSKQYWELTSPIQEYRLDKQWKNIVGNSYFFHLLKIINKETQVVPRWRLILQRAAILSAKSHFESDLAAAFLYNWIAIELLLKDRSGDTGYIIADRITALFGWLKEEDETYWINTIIGLYKKRNKFVHAGKIDQIQIKDLLISDRILNNLLTNLTRLSKTFPSKSAVTEFCDKVNARKLLGLKIKWPNFRYLKPRISDREILEIKKKKNW